MSHNVASALAGQRRNIRFLHAAFDVGGDSFVAGDYQGHIFKFDIQRNRFVIYIFTASFHMNV